jgi:hypothetical protein
MRNRHLLLPLVVAPIAASTLTPALSVEPRAAAEPIVGLKDGKIAQCGGRLTFDRDGETIAIEVDLTRHSEDTRFRLRATTSDSADPAARFRKLEATTASISSTTLFAAPDLPTELGTLAYECDAAAPAVTTFIQELMVSGAQFRLLRSDGRLVELATTGPLPQSTRAAYLNCTGDLYRPEE